MTTLRVTWTISMTDRHLRERDVPGRPQTTRFAEHTKGAASATNLGGMADTEPDLSNQTPVDIDTKLAALHTDRARALSSIDNTMNRLLTVVQPDHWSRHVETMTGKEVLDEAYRRVEDPEADSYQVNALNKYLASVHDSNEDVDALDMQIDTLDDEFNRRGGWTRAFLVSNVNGHVHRSMDCSTCFPTTEYSWMTEYSGGTEDAVVEDAGKRACTVCYPSAPIDVLNRPTKMFSEEEKRAQRDREERAAAKVERDAKKLAKAILPDGEPLKIPTWMGSEGQMHYDRIQSLVAARTRLTDLCEDWRKNDSDIDKEAKAMIAEAIASKEGKTVEQVLDEAAKRAAKRK